MVSSEFSVCRQEVSFLLCTAGGKRTTEPIARRRASGAGKPNGWLVAPYYFRGSRPSSPRPSGPLHFSFQCSVFSRQFKMKLCKRRFMAENEETLFESEEILWGSECGPLSGRGN